MNLNDAGFKHRTYRSAFYELLNMYITETQGNTWFKQLELAGFTEEEICYAIYIEYRNIRTKVLNKSFWVYFIKAIFRVYNDDRKEKYEVIIKERKLSEKHKRNVDKIPSSINGFVYFIQGVNGGPIKIGFSENVEKRLKALQTSYPEELVIIKQIKATNKEEHCIHKELDKYKIRREWFEDTLVVKNKIEAIRDFR